MKKATFIFFLICILIGCSNTSRPVASPSVVEVTGSKVTVTQWGANTQPSAKPASSPISSSAIQLKSTHTNSPSPVIIPTQLTMAPPPENSFYLWSYKGSYTRISILDLEKPQIKTFSNAQDSPTQAIDVAFAPYTSKVAYLLGAESPKNEAPQLWITDLEQSWSEKVWEDKDGWLRTGTIVSPGETQELIWISDRYVLLTRPGFSIRSNLLIYDAKIKETWEGQGQCNILAMNLKTTLPTIVCDTLRDDKHQTYLWLNPDGFQSDEKEPDILANIDVWSFSPDGSQVLFSGLVQKTYKIALPGGRIVPIPVTFDPGFYVWGGGVNIQWSANGERILLLGKPANHRGCALAREFFKLGLDSQHCWMVLDSKTFEILWMPTQEIWPEDTLPVEFSLFSLNAALSPDGRWVALTVDSWKTLGSYSLIVFDIENKRSYKVELGLDQLPGFYIHWKPQ